MSEPQSELQVIGDYRLDVTDFGPIVKASVDLRPLTVFIGPSNTGKSYLAILIYALHQCFGRISVGPPGLLPQRLRIWPMDRPELELLRGDETAWNSLRDWIANVSDEPLPPLPSDIATHLYPVLKNATSFNQLIESQMCRCYGASDINDLIRRVGSSRKAGNATIDVSSPSRGTTERAARYRLRLSGGSSNVAGTIEDIEALSLAVDHDLRLKRWVTDVAEHLFTGDRVLTGQAWVVLDPLADLLFRSWFRPLNRIAHYLPADRTGVMHSHQVVVSTLVQNATTVGRRSSSDGPMLSGILADFLDQLIEMSSTQRGRRPSSAKEPAMRIEKDILKGTVRLDRAETGYPVFAYRPQNWKSDLPLMQASSMVSELAPVVLYLRHIVQPDDVLIIEEPESHLHPAMQAVFARELARLARSGIRVVVTTHSEWLLDQFANLVRLSGLPEDKRKEFPGADAALRPEQFGAWLFKPKQRPKGSVVEEIRVDPDAGGLLTDYSDIAEQLYNEWVGIGNRITESGK